MADAGEPSFRKLKETIGPNHALPSDILSGARPVIAYFIAFSAAGWAVYYHRPEPYSNKKT